MLTSETKRHIDAARQVLVGVVPNPSSQIDQITNALIYKFMDDMDQSAIKAGGKPSFFIGELERYAWTRLMESRMGNQERMNLYVEALLKFSEAKQLPELFRGIFKAAFLPYRSPEVLGLFLQEISYFDYSHSEELGNAYEYLLSIMSSQGDAGQFRTPRHIIDFIVDVVDPTKDDKVLDPACGTAGFLINAYKHVIAKHDGVNADGSKKEEKTFTPDQRKALLSNFEGYDIDPSMVRIAQVNMYLHQFKNPKIYSYNTLTDDDRWNDKFDVILANPPFMSPKGGVSTHNKFSIDSSRSEVLFVDYILQHLKPKGRAGFIVPEGIIFQSGNAHTQLRKKLIENGLYAVISLPSGVFQPYSGVKTSILLLDFEVVKKCTQILFVNIKDVGVSLGASQMPIDENDLKPAISIINKFKAGEAIGSSKLAFVTDRKEILPPSYDFSLAKYYKKNTTNSETIFVRLSKVCNISKGKSSSTKSEPGVYPLLLTAEESKTADHFDYDGEGVCVPLISATGHGKAAINRVHFAMGKFALANLLAFVEPKDREVLHPKYLYYCLNSSKDEMARLMKGAANVSMKVDDLAIFEIPLPPLEVQEQIVEELDGYQKIISGARQVVENWKPRIEVDPEWEKMKLPAISENHDRERRPVTKSDRNSGSYPYYGASGIVDYVDEYIFDGDYLLVSEDGANLLARSTPIAFSISGKAWVNNHAHILKFNDPFTQKFVEHYLNQIDLSKFITGMAQPKLNQQALNSIDIPLPPSEIRRQIVERIETEQALAEGNKKLIEIYEEKTKETLAKLWNS